MQALRIDHPSAELLAAALFGWGRDLLRCNLLLVLELLQHCLYVGLVLVAIGSNRDILCEEVCPLLQRCLVVVVHGTESKKAQPGTSQGVRIIRRGLEDLLISIRSSLILATDAVKVSN